MLAEERLSKIISIVNRTGSVTIAELMKVLDASESTIRRDLNTLHEDAKLIKVRGGAISAGDKYSTRDDEVVIRKGLNVEEKQKIAAYAAHLITDSDFVFIDAGTTTEMMIPFISSRNAVFVTNATSHALKLSKMGLSVYIIGGEFKSSTQAIVGEEAIKSLEKYNFTKGFFGTNGITKEHGFTTPEIRESLIKRYAIQKCVTSYVLADSSKFSKVSAITFSDIDDATVITESVPAKYKEFRNIEEV